MGSCMSSNGTINVQRYPNPRKSTNKSIGCLTSLCKGEDNLMSDNKQSSEIVPNPQIKSSFSIHCTEDKLNKDIDLFIEKYKSKLKIEKINFVQLFNIFMNYKYNFTKSEFILCDIRDKLNEKNQSFLKQFPKINYDINELQLLDKTRLFRFFKFINGKKIIFILKETKEENSVDIIEKFIVFYLANQNKFSFDSLYILNQYITKYEEKEVTKGKSDENNETKISYGKHLNYFIDEDLLYNYSPKVLVNSSDIQSANLNYNNEIINNSYIFFDIFEHVENREFNIKKSQIKISSKFDINYLSHKETIETDLYLNFISKFNIIYIVNFIIVEEIDYNINKKNSKYIWHCETKRNKAANEDKKNLIKQKNVLIPKNMEFNEYYKIIHNEFIPLLEELLDQIINNNCILIQFDEKIEYIFMMKFIYIIIFRITGLTFDNIFEYLKINFVDLSKESSIKDKKDEFLNVLA